MATIEIQFSLLRGCLHDPNYRRPNEAGNDFEVLNDVDNMILVVS